MKRLFAIAVLALIILGIHKCSAQPAPAVNVEYKLVSDSSLKVLPFKPGKMVTKELPANGDRLFILDIDTFASVPMILRAVVVPKFKYVDVDNELATHSGAWSKAVNVAGWFNNTLSYSNVKGNTITFQFTGDHIEYVTEKYSTHGKVGVKIDNETEIIYDLYSKDRKLKEVVLSRNLPYGNHVITLRVTGEKNTASTGLYVLLDYFRVRKLNE